MKTAKELLQAYIDGSPQEAAALFAKKGALELPYLADLDVEPGYEGPKSIGSFLTFLHEKMYPNFKFVDVTICIDTPEQAFAEYTIHQKSGISGKDVHQRFFGHCTIMWPFDQETTGLPTTHKPTGSYIMRSGSPYAHVHIMGRQ